MRLIMSALEVDVVVGEDSLLDDIGNISIDFTCA
jgi:hypothetical protein